MKSLEIKNKKSFMNRFLMQEEFDDFLLKEAVIMTSNMYTINGIENRDYYDNDEDIIKEESPYDYATWRKMRPIIQTLIRGKHTPVSMKITMYLKPDLAKEVLEGDAGVVDYLIINLHYSQNGMNITTGLAYREFTMDKDQEKLWDAYVTALIGDE